MATKKHPTKKPQNVRIALTVPPEIDAKLKRLSELIGQPKTTIITGFLAELVPNVDILIDSIEKARHGQREVAIQTMADFVQKASLDLNQARLELDEMKGEGDGK